MQMTHRWWLYVMQNASATIMLDRLLWILDQIIKSTGLSAQPS